MDTIDLDLTRERVKNGAQLLDAKVPGWHRTIREASEARALHMGVWSNCVSGHLGLKSYEGAKMVFTLGDRKLSEPQVAEIGLTFPADYCPPPLDAWNELRSMWLEEVEARE